MGNQAEGTPSGAAGAAGAAAQPQGQGGLVSVDDLNKSMSALEQIVKGSPMARQTELMQKSLKEGKLPEDENIELMKLLAGEKMSKALTEAIEKSFDLSGTQQFQKSADSVDASPYLDELDTRISTAFGSFAEHIEKSETRHQEQIVVLAKGLYDLGTVLRESVQLQKGLNEQLQKAMSAPARPPRAVQAGQGTVMEKGFGDQGPLKPGNTISKQDLVKSLLEMQEDGPLSKSGEDILTAIAKLEANPGINITQVMLQDVLMHKQGKMNGVAR